MFYRFVFMNMTTGETREAIAAALDSAARAAGLPVNGHNHTHGHSLRAPWSPLECWNAQGECLWHFDAAGCIRGRLSPDIGSKKRSVPRADAASDPATTNAALGRASGTRAKRKRLVAV